MEVTYVLCGSLYHYMTACTHLGNSMGHRTLTLAAHLLFIIDLVRYEAVLHSCGTSPVAGRLVPTCDIVYSW